MIVIHISGMPGSGKTTLGKKISQRMKNLLKVVDTDDLITIKQEVGQKLIQAEQELTNEKYLELWKRLFREEILYQIDIAIQQKQRVLVFVGILDHWGHGSNPIEIEEKEDNDKRSKLYKFYLNPPLFQLFKQRNKRYYSLNDDFWRDVANEKEYIESSKELIQTNSKTLQWHLNHGYTSISDSKEMYKRIKKIVFEKE